ncbi:amino acid adenylation domain-containing protein [Streptomyces sp. Isolate_45]|uniref:amino acid adenylation domain-containing protein n=1 Tax=Streptomyces sp. Isolate_45 TaxID=2950111 RepID=UPI002481F2E6|nr:amino acid adenylation domain-containing protein [Streptomyces sp. Isolate_45]MDA5282552.1 amino acid adenylation domain-containing protein [Streptomyces sp. Isolate_45]
MNKTNDIEAIYPLSPLQHAMLLKSQLTPNSGVYVVQLAFDVCGPLDAHAFRATWDEVTARHAAHRTLFMRLDQSRPLQVVRRRVSLPWSEEDWSGLPADEQETRFDAFMAEDRGQDFELSRAPLMRCFLVRLSEDRHRFLWTRHHAISDGWSMPVVMGEIMRCYRALVEGGSAALGPVTEFREYIAWLRAQDAAKAEDYWRRSLAGVRGPTSLGVDRPTAGHREPGRIERRRVLLSRETTAALQGAARRERITLSTLVQGAWAVLLRRYGGERDVLLGMVTSGRPPSIDGVESMVGCVLNTLPVRVIVDDEARAADWLRKLQMEQVEREEYGYSPLSEIRRWTDVQGDVPLFESLVVFENFPLGAALDAPGAGIRVESVRMSEQTSFPLTLVVAPGEQMSIQVAFDEDRFDPAAVERMLEHYQVLLTGLADAQGTIGTLPIVGELERQRLLADWNGPTTDERVQPAVHQLFEAQVAATPDATALIAGDVQFSYAALDSVANGFARRLRAAGVTPGAFVGVCLDRDAHLPAALLAIWKVGAAYVPLDPTYPAARVDQILADAAPTVVLAQASTRQALSRSSARLLMVDEEADRESPAEAGAPAGCTALHEQSVAIVIYTSGSTGTPKGVKVTHRNVGEFLAWAREVFSPAELEGTLASTSICFDLSVFELFLPLTTGATVILAGNALLLPSLPARHSVTLVNTVPSAMDALLRLGELPDRLRVVNLGGEPVPRDLVDRLYARDGIRKVHNLYGPSEDTVYSTFALVAEDGTKPLIGRPIANTQAYVLDRSMIPVPTGVAGELYLGGEGVAQGYHRRPSLTAERFVPDPFGKRPGARLFRTGDLARWLPHGELEYLGRNDRQVKLRGFRIELGEIDVALRKLNGVRAAVTVVREDRMGTKRLVAYVVAEAGHGIDRAEAVAAVRATLPEYMVPAGFVELGTIPLTPNGKVDWAALPSPEPARAQRAYRAPSAETEKAIAAIWEAVLGVSRPGADDGFFDLGGDSILLARVFGQLKAAYPNRVTMTDLYRYPTIASLARHISGSEDKPAFAGVQGRLERRRAAMGAARTGDKQ